jgi:hypothetical protein
MPEPSVMNTKDVNKLMEKLYPILRIGIAFFRKKYPEDRKRRPLMYNGQDQKIHRKAPQHPIRAID